MKKWSAQNSYLAAVVVMGLLLSSSCAHRYRDASSGRTGQEVGDMLNTLSSSSNGNSAETQKVIELLKKNPEATVYFAEAPGEMGPIHAVVPVNFAFLSNTQIGINGLDVVRVFFVDLLTDAGHKNALVFQYRAKGQTTFASSVFTNFDQTDGLGEIGEGEFRSVLKRSDGAKIVVRSYDVDPEADDDLSDVVQLEINGFDQDGNEGENLGQISSMEGFSIYF